MAEDESIAAAKAKETQMIADDAEADLNKALPYLKNAIKALDALDKNDIAELKVFSNPPDLVMTVMETVSLMGLRGFKWLERWNYDQHGFG